MRLDLTFLTPALPDDLDVLSWPATYVEYELRATDGRSHQVKLYLDASSHLAVNRPEQRSMWSRHRTAGMDVLRIGSTEQSVLVKLGNDLRIDWGYFYLAVPPGQPAATVATSVKQRSRFAHTLELPASDLLDTPVQVSRVGDPRCGLGGRTTTLAISFCGARRPVLDRVFSSEAAALLAPQRNERGRVAERGCTALPGTARALPAI